MIAEAFVAALMLGLPVGILSWFILKQLYEKGELDRAANHKQVAADIKALRKTRRSAGARTGFLQTKWMQFGGGFYGFSALWTFFCIELLELKNLIFNFPGLDKLLEGGIINLLVALFVNQIQNFVAAIVWFNYWADNGQEMLVWAVAAYAGYAVGLNAARNGGLPGFRRPSP